MVVKIFYMLHGAASVLHRCCRCAAGALQVLQVCHHVVKKKWTNQMTPLYVIIYFPGLRVHTERGCCMSAA